MSFEAPWLGGLLLKNLHQIAVLVGAPCSGTKMTRIAQIQRTVLSAAKERDRNSLSLLSVDMGIRNLAFAHIQATRTHDRGPFDRRTLQDWRRIAISHPLHITTPGSPRESRGSEPADAPPEGEESESFEPAEVAQHAYVLIKHLLQTYRPDRILIERQRFRSGGRAAVPEWIIRVGVFEGMLYSVLRTLVEEQQLDVAVEGVQPTRVNRYWFEGDWQSDAQKLSTPALSTTTGRMRGRDTKKAKVDLAGHILSPSAHEAILVVDESLRPFVDQYLAAITPRRPVARGLGSSKLDDLADSLLQGVAWIEWQNRREMLLSNAASAVDWAVAPRST